MDALTEVLPKILSACMTLCGDVNVSERVCVSVCVHVFV